MRFVFRARPWWPPAISGLLLMLSWHNVINPGISSWPGVLAMTALVPFLWVWEKATVKHNFFYGMLRGFIYFMGILFWLGTVNRATNVDNRLFWVLFSLYGALYFGLFAATTAYIRDHTSWPRLSWAGMTAYFRAGFQERGTNLLVSLGFALPGLAVAGLSLWDAWAFHQAPKADINLALIQGNINTDQPWDEAYFHKTMDKMTKLHLRAVRANPYLIIWAESCFSGLLECGKQKPFEPFRPREKALRALIKQGRIPTLLTASEYVPTFNLEGRQFHHYNSAFLLGKNGETLGQYRKIMLVPGGEYIPWNWLKAFLHTAVRGPLRKDFEPGTDDRPLHIGRLRFSPLICYEDHSEELGRRFARKGALFFAALANSGATAEKALGLEHTTMSTFLAVENRMPIAKADMTGPTCIIDAWGHISRALPYYKEGVKITTIQVTNYRTFFTRFGNIFPWSATLLFLGLWFWAGYQRRRHQAGKNQRSGHDQNH